MRSGYYYLLITSILVYSLILSGCGKDDVGFSSSSTNSGGVTPLPPSPSPSPSVTPSPSPTPTNTITWSDISPPEYVKKIISHNNILYAISDRMLYKSNNDGSSWQVIPINLTSSSLNSIDIDQNKIYIACDQGIIVSQNLNGEFTFSFDWGWDGCSEVDMQDGYGWGAVPMWGNMSGPIRKIPDNVNWERRVGDIPGEDISMGSAKADPINPLNIAYVGRYVTTDGGIHWISLGHKGIDYITILNNISTAFRYYDSPGYTEDHGSSWKNIGINEEILSMTKDQNGLLYAATVNSIFRGTTGNWQNLGQHILSIPIQNIVVYNNMIFVSFYSSTQTNNLRKAIFVP